MSECSSGCCSRDRPQFGTEILKSALCCNVSHLPWLQVKFFCVVYLLLQYTCDVLGPTSSWTRRTLMPYRLSMGPQGSSSFMFSVLCTDARIAVWWYVLISRSLIGFQLSWWWWQQKALWLWPLWSCLSGNKRPEISWQAYGGDEQQQRTGRTTAPKHGAISNRPVGDKWSFPAKDLQSPRFCSKHQYFPSHLQDLPPVVPG